MGRRATGARRWVARAAGPWAATAGMLETMRAGAHHGEAVPGQKGGVEDFRKARALLGFNWIINLGVSSCCLEGDVEAGPKLGPSGRKLRSREEGLVSNHLGAAVLFCLVNCRGGSGRVLRFPCALPSCFGPCQLWLPDLHILVTGRRWCHPPLERDVIVGEGFGGRIGLSWRWGGSIQ